MQKLTEYACSDIHHLFKLGFSGTDQCQRLSAGPRSSQTASCSFSQGFTWPCSDVFQFYWLWCVCMGQSSALQLPVSFEKFTTSQILFLNLYHESYW